MKRSVALSLKRAALSVGTTAITFAAAFIEDWREAAHEQAAAGALAALDTAVDRLKTLLNALLATAGAAERAAA